MTHLLRGLFRLQTLEERTLAQINTRAQPRVYEHALEFSLAYRVGLAERLNLPGQPRAMSPRGTGSAWAARRHRWVMHPR